jgi:DNA gyrase inhibitor GyrI
MYKHTGLSSMIVAAMGCLALAAASPAARTSAPATPQAKTKAQPAAQPVAKQTQSFRAAVTGAKAATLHAVVMTFTGTFEDLPRRFDEFTKAFEAQGLSKKKLPSNPTGIYVVYEDPEGKNTYKLGVGVHVPAKLDDVKDPLTNETFTLQRAARVMHTGPYKDLGNVRNEVVRAAAAMPAAKETKGAFPVIARLLNDPRKVPEKERRAELVIPF